MVATATATATNQHPTRIEFQTATNGDTSPQNRVIIYDDGLINLDSYAGTGTRKICVDSNGDVTECPGDSHRQTTGTTTIGDTGQEGDCYGGTLYSGSSATYTIGCDLGSTYASQMSFTLIDTSGSAITLDPGATKYIILDGAGTGEGMAQGDTVLSTSTKGDIITCSYYSSTQWYCASGSPDGDHWSDNN